MILMFNNNYLQKLIPDIMYLVFIFKFKKIIL